MTERSSQRRSFFGRKPPAHPETRIVGYFLVRWPPSSTRIDARKPRLPGFEGEAEGFLYRRTQIWVIERFSRLFLSLNVYPRSTSGGDLARSGASPLRVPKFRSRNSENHPADYYSMLPESVMLLPKPLRPYRNDGTN